MSNAFGLETWREVVTASLREAGTALASTLPNVFGMLALLAIGWATSRIAGSVVTRFLSRIGTDRAGERIGLAALLEQAGIETSLSRVFGTFVFWILMLTFVLSAVETLGLEAVTLTIDRLIAYLPSVLGALVIAVVGLLLARLAGSVVGSAAAAAQLPYARPLASVTRGATGLMAAILAVEHLGVNTELLSTLIVAVIAALAFAMGLAFALGARDVVRGILAGHYLRQTLSEGDVVETANRRGRVERIGSVDTLFRDAEGSWSVPNAILLNETLVRS